MEFDPRWAEQEHSLRRAEELDAIAEKLVEDIHERCTCVEDAEWDYVIRQIKERL